MARLLLAMLSLAPFCASAADDQRVSFLEQEVRNLQRQVQVLSRQIDELRTRSGRPAEPASESAQSVPPGGAPATTLPRWVDASKWRQLRRGMSELEVVGLLGLPTSMREESGARVLLYAMEIGSSGFLGGSVTLRNRTLAEVQQPTLQ
jgi:hypothetical protein